MNTKRNLLSGLVGVLAGLALPAAKAGGVLGRGTRPPPSHCKWTVMIDQAQDGWDFAVFLEQAEPGVGAVGKMGSARSNQEAIEEVMRIISQTPSANSLSPHQERT